MHKHILISLTLLALASCSSPNSAKKETPAKPAAPPASETTFEGYFSDGMSLMGASKGRVLLFLDPSGRTAPNTETPGALLDALAANAADLRSGLDYSIALLPETTVSIEKKPVKDMAFLTAYPVEALKLAAGPKIKGPFVRAKPGKFTQLAQVVEAHGPEREHQSWKGAAYQDFAMEGVVYWWGNTGLKAAPDGSITHVLLRGKSQPAQ